MSANVVTMTTENIPAVSMPGDDSGWEHDTWRVTLTFEGRSMGLLFHAGTGHRVDGVPAAPSIGSVLYTVLSDAATVDQCPSPHDLAEEFGMDTDDDGGERVAAIHAAMVDQTDAAARVFGRDRLAELSHDTDGIEDAEGDSFILPV